MKTYWGGRRQLPGLTFKKLYLTPNILSSFLPSGSSTVVYDIAIIRFNYHTKRPKKQTSGKLEWERCYCTEDTRVSDRRCIFSLRVQLFGFSFFIACSSTRVLLSSCDAAARLSTQFSESACTHAALASLSCSLSMLYLYYTPSPFDLKHWNEIFLIFKFSLSKRN